jgi:hypothetical protein
VPRVTGTELKLAFPENVSLILRAYIEFVKDKKHAVSSVLSNCTG